MKHPFLLSLCGLFLTISLFAQENVKVTTIEVWAKVVDASGNSVTGLQAEDFALTEDGKPVSPSCFEETRSAGSPQETGATTSAELQTKTTEKSTAAVPAKKIVIFLDLYDTNVGELLFIKPKLNDFLAGLAGGGHDIMIAGMLPDRRMGVLQPFTSDLTKIRDLLEKTKANAGRDSQIEGNETELNRILMMAKHAHSEQSDAPPENQRDIATAPGRSGQSVENVLQQAYQMAYNFSRQDSEATRFCLRALGNMGQYLASIPGNDHITVVFISGGFSMDPGRRYFDMVDQAAEDLREQIQSPELAVFHSPENQDYRKDLENAIQRLNRLNLTLYTINTRGLIASDPNIAKRDVPRSSRDLVAIGEYGDTLGAMAEETGGVAFNNSQNFKLGFTTILKDLESQYLLCYNPPPHAKTGEFHSIKLVVNKPGVKTRYRNGYID